MPYHLAMASHSFHELNVDRLLPRIAEMNLSRVEFNDRHVSVFASDRDLARFEARLEEAGIDEISMYTSRFGETEDEARRVFEFAEKAGLRFFAAAPPPEQLPMLSELAGAHGVPLALHNSSGERSPYRSIADVRAALKAHPNLSACLDLGHFALAGTDPARAVQALGDRALEIHAKDLTTFDRVEGENPYTVVGQGRVDWNALFDAFDATGFDGWLTLEYQADFWDLAARAEGIRASIAALRRMVEGEEGREGGG
jgi:sugar phosphate isomerase/epimerase